MLVLPVRMSGNNALVRLLRPHTARLEKAAELLAMVAALPCEEAEEAATVAKWLRMYAKARESREGTFLPGQLKLPFPPDGEEDEGQDDKGEKETDEAE